jgi:hypothetical protein
MVPVSAGIAQASSSPTETTVRITRRGFHHQRDRDPKTMVAAAQTTIRPKLRPGRPRTRVRQDRM